MFIATTLLLFIRNCQSWLHLHETLLVVVQSSSAASSSQVLSHPIVTSSLSISSATLPSPVKTSPSNLSSLYCQMLPSAPPSSFSILTAPLFSPFLKQHTSLSISRSTAPVLLLALFPICTFRLRKNRPRCTSPAGATAHGKYSHWPP